MKRTTRGLLLCPFAASLCCAQVAPQEGLEEILVTAQRREQRPQDVPISLSVFSTDELERRQIDDIDALQFAAPNLVVASNMTSRNAAAIAMRGQFERDATPTVDPAVGLYIDGVYFARTTGANLRMIDVARVEVLRGPQGTLFGRNTVGGAINVIPHRPGAGLEGFASASFGNYNRRDLTGVINFPLYESGSAKSPTTTRISCADSCGSPPAGTGTSTCPSTIPIPTRAASG
jgi:iron complex outermembrane receptor protein